MHNYAYIMHIMYFFKFSTQFFNLCLHIYVNRGIVSHVNVFVVICPAGGAADDNRIQDL